MDYVLHVVIILKLALLCTQVNVTMGEFVVEEFTGG